VDVRQDALLRTACAVISERGLAGTRTADVAAAAGVSQALLFYHFTSREELLLRAFAYAADSDLRRLDAVLAAAAPPALKLRQLLQLHAPDGRRSAAWPMWIDGWAGALRNPELELIARRRARRWQQALAGVIEAGVAAGAFRCPDPAAAAGRICALLDGLAVRTTVHPRLAGPRQAADWLRLAAARELDVDAAALR
jgi:AcrR family transcriptional regulator